MEEAERGGGGVWVGSRWVNAGGLFSIEIEKGGKYPVAVVVVIVVVMVVAAVNGMYHSIYYHIE